MKTYTTKEAAKELGITEGHVRLLLLRGKLKGEKWGRDWMITSLDYQRQRLPRGQRKRGKASGIVTSDLSKPDAQELSESPKRNERG